MICFRDKTFCITPGCSCADALTPEIQAAARRWWGSDEAPIAVAYLHGGDPDHSKPQQETEHARQNPHG